MFLVLYQELGRASLRFLDVCLTLVRIQILSSLIFCITYSFCIFSLSYLQPSSYRWLILSLNAEASEISNFKNSITHHTKSNISCSFCPMSFAARSYIARRVTLFFSFHAARETISYRHFVISLSWRSNDMFSLVAGTRANLVGQIF